MASSDTKCCLNGCFRVLPTTDFGPSPRSRDGLTSLCRECTRRRAQLAKHGLTSEDKAAIAAEQGGCALCPRTEPGAKGWVVDHDRSCCPGDRSCESCRRGVLCSWCNSALGYAGDDPALLRRMADYIEAGTRVSLLRLAPATPYERTPRTERTNDVPTVRNHLLVVDAHAHIQIREWGEWDA